MPLVTLTTDFGHSDIYIGRFKGKLLKTIGDLNIIDLTHEIPSFNTLAGGFSLKYTYDCFPTGTIHIARVYEQGVKSQGLLGIKSNGHYFLAPNNGILSLALDNQYDWIKLVNMDLFAAETSDDIYAIALKSILAQDLESIFIEPVGIIENTQLEIIRGDDFVRGTVAFVDHFGNLITNIHVTDLISYLERFSAISVFYRTREAIHELVSDYNDVAIGETMCRITDTGYLEIANNKAPANKMLGIDLGQKILVEFHDS